MTQTAALPLITSAADALARYEDFYSTGALRQAQWHGQDDDGRQLACALGVLGADVDSPKDCPASVMPRWLAQMVPGFFDRQKKDDAFDWGRRFYAALARCGGNVPFSVIHDWHANTVTILGVEVAEKCGRDVAPHVALQKLHQRALAGETIGADVWRPVLNNANANAYAYANANADAYANANADANANANAYAYTCAYTCAYADAYANAYANADANAYADADAYADAWKRLADGMVDALNRLPAA